MCPEMCCRRETVDGGAWLGRRPGAYFNLVVSLCQHLICCGSVGMSEGSEEEEDVCIRNIYRTGGVVRRSESESESKSESGIIGDHHRIIILPSCEPSGSAGL